LPCAAGVEEAIAAFERRLLASNKTLTGTLRVTCPEALVTPLVSPLVDAFQTQYPHVQIDLIVTERFLDLSRGEADIAIRGGEPRDDVLVSRKISDTPWAVYASRSYIDRHGQPKRPEDIDQHVIVDFGGVANLHLGEWLRTVAPHAKVATHCETEARLPLLNPVPDWGSCRCSSAIRIRI
jgi:DNA-binding transcriptional LysR family regulator